MQQQYRACGSAAVSAVIHPMRRAVWSGLATTLLAAGRSCSAVDKELADGLWLNCPARVLRLCGGLAGTCSCRL